jgi:hypothetical protein
VVSEVAAIDHVAFFSREDVCFYVAVVGEQFGIASLWWFVYDHDAAGRLRYVLNCDPCLFLRRFYFSSSCYEGVNLTKSAFFSSFSDLGMNRGRFLKNSNQYMSI